jgi:hypothetical protein
MDRTTTSPVSTQTAPAEPKTYNTPTLTDFGSFSEITQGTFAGVGGDNVSYS